MGINVIQCLDCGAWNWKNVECCQTCGSKNLTASFDQVYQEIVIDQYMPFGLQEV
jgi:hypothetical protein